MESQAYEQFCERIRELSDLGNSAGYLSWDQEVCMPKRGVEARAQALGTLAGIHHEKLTDQGLVDLIEALQGQDLDDDAAINVREAARTQQRALNLPKELVVELSRTQSLAHEAWVEARSADDFGQFQPWLEKLLELQKRVADAVGYEGAVYNAFLDEYEPHARVEQMGPLLEQLRVRLVPLVGAILDKARGADPTFAGHWDVDRQESFGRQVIGDLGFDWDAGRLDVSVHPFCGGAGPHDVRLTTRYQADQLTSSLFGIIHETGHGLYEQGLPGEQAGLPVCESISLGIHESQSRMWENMVGRSRPFWQYQLPRLQAVFPELKNVDVEQMYREVNRVEASMIRVEADEVTYNLHILLRFELEQAMVSGEISVADLPGLWNERMESYLGIRPANDAEGVLQDIHWSGGLMGYFPTYTLGNLYAAQFFVQAREDLGDLDEQFARGDTATLLRWLRENIHSQGRRLTATELVTQVTGRPLGIEDLMNYLEGKFGELYDL
ncbi:MAG: carboxypeptidase M32 [Candidatus Latescibacterota bacterium]|nr:carboxypeptidase M32 [Candidatus Latescibacterota bacterium]